MSALTSTPKKMGSIRGDRFYFKVTKLCTGVSGFAPEHYRLDVCDVVVSFVDFDPYVQFSQDCPNTITAPEMKELYDLVNRGFVENDFKNVNYDE